MDLRPGALIGGQFRVVAPLVRGGMGAVYVVEQLGTGYRRALKVMHPLLVSDTKSHERFVQEAQVGARLESDHVVQVIAAGIEGESGTPWLCMELLEGRTLEDAVRDDGPLAPPELAEVVAQLGHALAAAHRIGLVHRDLKPENLFLSTPRRPGVSFTLKVLDFGIAKWTQEGGSDGSTSGSGTPLWMAPEQMDTGRITPAADVWALGLVVFYALTGHLYWRTAANPERVLGKLIVEVLTEPLEPASARARALAGDEVAARVPRGFDEWFARAVVREPGARFADGGAAVAALLPLLRGAEDPLVSAEPNPLQDPSRPAGDAPRAALRAGAPSRRPPRAGTRRAAFAALAAVALVAAGIVATARFDTPRPSGAPDEAARGAAAITPSAIVSPTPAPAPTAAPSPAEPPTPSAPPVRGPQAASAAETPTPSAPPVRGPQAASAAEVGRYRTTVLQRCWADNPAPDEAGARVEVRLRFGDLGRVESVRIDGVAAPEFRRCVATRSSSYRFHEPPRAPALLVRDRLR